MASWWRATFRARSLWSSRTRTPGAASDASSAGRRSDGPTNRCSAPSATTTGPRSIPCGVPNSSSKWAGRPAPGTDAVAWGRNEKIPPPSLPTTTIVAARPCSRAATRPDRSCRSARSPITSATGAPVAAAPTADDTTPSIPLAPRLARGRIARGPAGSQASMSRTGIELLAHRIHPSGRRSPRRANGAPSNTSPACVTRPSQSRRARSAARSAASHSSSQRPSCAGPGRRWPPAARRPRRSSAPASATAVAAASACTMVAGIAAGSRQPASPSTTISAGRRSSRRARTGLEVGIAPNRRTSPGTWASRQGPGRSRWSPRARTRDRSWPPHRASERGSARTGHSRAAAR